MTEDEMKTKWCPHVRLAAPVGSEAQGTAGNRYGDDHGKNFCCIGSACSQWQWTGIATESIYTHGPDIAHVPLPEGEGWLRTFSSENGWLITGSNGDGATYDQVWTRPRPDGTRTGVCGLVNK